MNVQQSIGNVATGMAVTGGMWSFMSDNAPALGLLLTASSICIASLFYYLNYRLNCRRLRIAVDDSKKGVKQTFSDDDLAMIERVLERRRRKEK